MSEVSSEQVERTDRGVALAHARQALVAREAEAGARVLEHASLRVAHRLGPLLGAAAAEAAPEGAEVSAAAAADPEDAHLLQLHTAVRIAAGPGDQAGAAAL